MSLLLFFGGGGGGGPPANKLGGVIRAQRMAIRRRWRPALVMVAPLSLVGPTHYSLLAETGTFTLTGNAAALRRDYQLTATTGSFTLTGNAAGLKVDRRLTAAVGAFTLTGNAAGLRVARVITAGTGAFTLTGNNAILTYSGGGATHYTLTAGTGTFVLTGNAAALRVARRLVAGTGAFTLTGNAAGLTYSGALVNLGQYLIELLGLDRWRLTDRLWTRYGITDHTVTRYTITEDPMTTVTTASAYLWLTEDQEAEFEFHRKNATTGVLEAASGLTGMTVHISATAGGSVIGSLTFNLTERGTTGIYYAVMDTATLVSGLSAASYPDGTAVYLVVSKSGDIASRSFRKTIKRQRVGDG